MRELFLGTRLIGATADELSYRTRLAARLYEEQLLDRDHYVDWMLSGLENSPLSKLPMWILLVQLYWKDLLSLRKSGRRFVTALLSHFTNVS